MIRLSPAQLTALDTAGVFEVDETDGLDVIRAAISGDNISPSQPVARAMHQLANGADEISRELGQTNSAMYRADSRSLTALACKISKRS